MTDVAYSPDGELLASVGDETVRLWDYDEPVGALSGHDSSVISVAFSPDGQLLAVATDDDIVRLWKLPERKLIGDLTGHTDSVNAVEFAPDGKWLASASTDGTIRLWQPQPEQQSR